MITTIHEYFSPFQRAVQSQSAKYQAAYRLYLLNLEQVLDQLAHDKVKGLSSQKKARQFLELALRAPKITQFQDYLEKEQKRNRPDTQKLAGSALGWLKDEELIQGALQAAWTNTNEKHKDRLGRVPAPFSATEITTKPLIEAARRVFLNQALGRLVI